MREFLWRQIARVLTRPAVTEWLIRRAQRTPYYPITNADGGEFYMDRWWLFSPYRKDAAGNVRPGWAERFGLPSIRVHHIMQADTDRHLHDHPWNARTVVLRGWYLEERPLRQTFLLKITYVQARLAGYTGRLLLASITASRESRPVASTPCFSHGVTAAHGVSMSTV